MQENCFEPDGKVGGHRYPSGSLIPLDGENGQYGIPLTRMEKKGDEVRFKIQFTHC
jgi:hypothetical protein